MRCIHRIKHLVLALLIGAAPICANATPYNEFPQTIQWEEGISETTLNNLFTQAATIWETTTTQLWQDYSDAILKVTHLGGIQYRLEHQAIDGGGAILVLEESF